MIAFQLFIRNVLAADASGHPRAETGCGNDEMRYAKTVRIVNRADAQAIGVEIVRPVGKTILVSANVENVLINQQNLDDAESRIIALDGADIASHKIRASGQLQCFRTQFCH